MTIKLFVFFSIYLTLHVIRSSTLPSPELHIKYGGQALNALENLLKFFEMDANDLNLDGLYGLRIAQGQLNALQNKLTSSAYENTHLTDANNHLQLLSDQIDRIANKSLTAIAQQQTEYLNRFTLVASRPFLIDYIVRKIKPHLIENGKKISEFDEDVSDGCFAELLGSTKDSNSKQCFVTHSCWKLMTSVSSSDYRITHQLLWFLIAKNIGCIDHRPISDLAIKNLNYLEDRYCSNIYQDAETNFVKNDNQDLFLEQILLCSMIGYEDFLRFDWFNTILTWQDSEYGCFNSGSDTNENNVRTKRHLLIEQEMTHGCLSHKSGLASGVLAVYARALLQ